MRELKSYRLWLPVLAASCMAAAGIAVEGQRAAPGEGRLIVRAVANGAPVADLKAEELSIRIDGKPRQVKALELVTPSSGTAAGAAPAPTAATPSPPFATTVPAAPAPAEAREFLILLDEESIAAGREESVRKAVATLMAEASPADRFGLISLRVGGRTVAASTNRQAVTGLLAEFVGGGSTRETAEDVLCRAKRSLGTLTEAFSNSPTGRTLIIFSPGMRPFPAAFKTWPSAATPRSPSELR